MEAVEIRDLSKHFDDLIAVDHFSVEVHKGEIFGLVGPDGAGKTTTFRCATTVMPPTSGTVRVAGFDVVAEASQVRDRIGYVSQRFSLYGDLTVSENLAFFADLHRVPKQDQADRRRDLLGFSRLQPFEKRLAQHLSGGMRQKLALACALMHTPEVLFLDEPTTGVDPVSRRDFWELLYSLVTDGLTLVVSTPYMDEAERCNRIGLMSGGQLVVVDTPAGLKNRMQGEILEVRCSDQRRAHTLLKEVASVRAVEIFGETLHLSVANAEEDWPAIETVLKENDVTVLSWRRTTPTLEDVFVSVVSGGTLHA